MSHNSHFARIAELYSSADASMARLLCDQHSGDKVAITIADGGSLHAMTYAQLRSDSTRLANGLRHLGVGPGTRVATLLRKGPELVTTMLAIWRLGAVYVPLFTAFASPAVEFRLDTSDAKVVVTDPAQRAKLSSHTGNPTSSRQVIVVGDPVADGDISYADLLQSAGDSEFTPYMQGPDGAVVHIFTSGTTGVPKGVIHPLKHVAGWHSYLENGLGVTDDSVYWCAADPGWAYGLYAAIVAPLATGRGTILHTGAFDPRSAWSLIERAAVTDFTSAPTVYRAIRAAFPSVDGRTSLRRLSSAGEPLTPEVNEWADRELGLLVHDHFGQTEVGMVVANQHHPDLAQPIVVGSMGTALPGWAVTIISEDSVDELDTGALGRLAIDVSASPAMSFTDYQELGKSAAKFTQDGRFYVLGDLALRDESGCLHFSARDDDVIIMAGYRIGPFEIESVLSTHPAVAESAAIAAPDAERGEVLEVYVVVTEGHTPSAGLAAEIQSFVKQNYAAHAYPRTVHFIESLPKTPSGKIQRFVLRQKRHDELRSGDTE